MHIVFLFLIFSLITVQASKDTDTVAVKIINNTTGKSTILRVKLSALHPDVQENIKRARNGQGQYLSCIHCSYIFANDYTGHTCSPDIQRQS